MLMYIDLPSEMEGFINNKIADGSYGNATEVIQDAITRMQVEEIRTAAWQSAIKLGDEQLDSGQGIPYTTESLEDITKSAINAMRNGLSIDPDVIP
jgi:antitoxin ParD1/3/4